MKKITTWSVVGIAFALMFCTCKLDAQTKTVDYVKPDGGATRVKYEKDVFGKTTVTTTCVSPEQRKAEKETEQNFVKAVGTVVYGPTKALWEAGEKNDSITLKAAAVGLGIVTTVAIGALFGL